MYTNHLVTPPRKINLHETLPLFQHQRQYPHSTFNLKTKVKASPNIYKYQYTSGNRLCSSSDRHQKAAKNKSFSSITTFNVNQLLQKSLITVENKVKKNLKPQINSSNLSQKNTRNHQDFVYSKLHVPSQDSYCNDLFKSEKKIDLKDNIWMKKQKETVGIYSSRKINVTDTKILERKNYSSKSRLRSSKRFMPWDLESGFGKAKRF